MREVYRLFRLNPDRVEKLKNIGLLVISLKNSVKADKSISVFNEYRNELEKLLLQCLA